jgi:hypothetical protein
MSVGRCSKPFYLGKTPGGIICKDCFLVVDEDEESWPRQDKPNTVPDDGTAAPESAYVPLSDFIWLEFNGLKINEIRTRCGNEPCSAD